MHNRRPASRISSKLVFCLYLNTDDLGGNPGLINADHRVGFFIYI